MKNAIETPPQHILCFSHLRWDFVFQRPQHILSRFSKDAVVYFLEEPFFDAVGEPYLSISKRSDNLHVVVPHLLPGTEAQNIQNTMTALIDKFLFNANMDDWIFWYYTPMAYSFTSKYKPRMVVYDCMDELSAFKFAPKELLGLERMLMGKADIVFTGGHSLFEAKKQQHANIFPFPSSIDRKHFAKAKEQVEEPADQARISGPKIGFFGVIDERFDIELIRSIAEERPEWQMMLIGPVVKISEEILPRNANIHYLGQKSYAELPHYLSGWDVALIPFALNESTRFISPTKTPEYLAAGVPVVSTPIHDVINPYGIKNLVHISGSVEGFIRSIEQEMKATDKRKWLSEVDNFLKNQSWDKTCRDMQKQIQNTLKNMQTISVAS